MKISGALEGLGGNIANAIASGNGLTFGFQDLEAGGVTVFGTTHYAYHNPSRNEIQFNLTVISGLSAPSVVQTPAPTSTVAATTGASEPSDTQMPAPAPASTVDPSLDSLGVAGRINDDLEPALEKALGIDLTVELLGEYPSGGGTKVNIAYALKADLPLSDDLSAKFSEVFESLGANISSADGAFGKLGFAFEGLRAGG